MNDKGGAPLNAQGYGPGDAPLADALERYRRRRQASFHVPGHKAGAAFAAASPAHKAGWLTAVGAYDATELPGLDDLHAPSGAIAAAQALAATCFGAERTYFLVGGSTVGNLAAIHAVVRPGDCIVMQRDVHKSAIHALMLREARAVFVAGEPYPGTGLPGPVRAEQVSRALVEHPEAKAVFLTRPNYYGIAEDLTAVAEAVHARGKPLIVDEAHGAHFGRDDRFPASALACGADIVIQSSHKMLSALTMGAMLHLQGDRVPAERVETYLRMLQSSSPSYPILASLDWARREVHAGGIGLFDEALEAIDRWRARHTPEGEARFIAQAVPDPLKLLLRDKSGALAGYGLSALLAEQGIFAEMATERYAVLACSAATRKRDLECLEQALEEIDKRNPAEKKEIAQNFSNMNELGMIRSLPSSPVRFRCEDWGASSADSMRIPLEQAAGEISAEMVIPYPPGIPVLYPGERIAAETVRMLLRLREHGAAMQGVRDPTLHEIAVRRNSEGS